MAHLADPSQPDQAQETPSACPASVAAYRPARRPLRVLVVGPVSDTGGLARMARMSAEGLDPARFDLRVCDSAKDTPENRSIGTACWSHLLRWGRLVRALREQRPEVVHLHTCSYGTFWRTWVDAATCRAYRRPYVLHIHGGLFAEFLHGLRGLRRWAAVSALRRAARIVVLSETWRTNLTREAAGLRISVIANAVEPGPSATTARAGSDIVFVGDLSEVKRPEDLIVAYAALPSELRCKHALVLIGGGTAVRRRLLSGLVHRLGVQDHVQFAGTLPYETVRARLAQAALFVLPSRAEGMPLALLEAMRTGVPTVATRVGAVPEMAVDGAEALLVDPRRPEALSRAMRRLLVDSALARQLTDAASARVAAGSTPACFRSAVTGMWIEVVHQTCPRGTLPAPRLASTTFRSIL